MTVQSDMFPMFSEDFLIDHARQMVTNPEIAIVELVANCWDAGADTVHITWPVEATPDIISIVDNGTGMTYEEFIKRWNQLNYNRIRTQGDTVIFPPDNQQSNRQAYGKNGKGRHSMFCFASKYKVETWRDGEMNVFDVVRATSISRAPYKVEFLNKYPQKGHGTSISADLARNHISVDLIRDLIGSKFIFDPSFAVHINNELVQLTNLGHLIDTKVIDITGIGEIKVSQVDTQKTSRTSRMHGVAWWVNKRLVGEPSWNEFDTNGFLDKRTIEAKRYTFVVEADVLSDEVEEDWAGFKKSSRMRQAKEAVNVHIRSRLIALMKDFHRERKQAAMELNIDELRKIPEVSRYYIGQTVDGIQIKMPSIKQEILTNTVAVLANLEKARTGYNLLEQLAKLKVHEIDDLSEILDKWSVQEARMVLTELERRLKLIEKLEALVDEPTSDELRDIHPLFEQGLWIFGPEFESVHFSSNRSLVTVLKELFNDNSKVNLTNPRRRPDLVVLPNSTLGVYASESFDEQSEVSGLEKVLIVELKRGGSIITVKEQRQAEDYAMELQRSGKVQESTNIVAYVLGSDIDQNAKKEQTRGTNIRVIARAYSVVIQQAHARTFHLIGKIREAKKGELIDLDVESIIERKKIELFSSWQR